MSSVFDAAFASAKTQYATITTGETVIVEFVMTLLEQRINEVLFVAGPLTYIPGTTSVLPGSGTPASFKSGNPLELLSSRFEGSDGGPFDPTKGSPLTVTITAPGVGVSINPSTYEVQLVFDAGSTDATTATLAPSFDATSSLAYGAIAALRTNWLATISLAEVLIVPAPAR